MDFSQFQYRSGDRVEKTEENLGDMVIVTISPEQFVCATEDEAAAIAKLINKIGQEEALGVIGWWATRNRVPFMLDGHDVLVTLQRYHATTQMTPDELCEQAFAHDRAAAEQKTKQTA